MSEMHSSGVRNTRSALRGFTAVNTESTPRHAFIPPVVESLPRPLSSDQASLISSHLHLDSDKVDNVLAELPTAGERMILQKGSTKRRKTTASNAFTAPDLRYIEDPPGVVRPLTPPPSIRRAAAGRRSITDNSPSLPQYRVTKPGLPPSQARLRTSTVHDVPTQKSTIPHQAYPSCGLHEGWCDNRHHAQSSNGAQEDLFSSSKSKSAAPFVNLGANVCSAIIIDLECLVQDTADIPEAPPNDDHDAEHWVYHPDIGLIPRISYHSAASHQAVSSRTPEFPSDTDLRSLENAPDQGELEDDDFLTLGTDLALPRVPPSSDQPDVDLGRSDENDFTDDGSIDFSGPLLTKSSTTSIPISSLSPSGFRSDGCGIMAKSNTISGKLAEETVDVDAIEENFISDDIDSDIEPCVAGTDPTPIIPGTPRTTVNLEALDLDMDIDESTAGIVPGKIFPPASESTSSIVEVPTTAPVHHTLTIDHTSTPIVRPSFPTAARDRSPITGLHPTMVLRTCFRIGLALNVGCAAARSNKAVIIELYGCVVASNRDPKTHIQHFTLADWYHPDRPPYLEAIFSAWKGVELWDKECAIFLGEKGTKRMCRCLGSMKRDEKGRKWIFEMRSIWEADWDDMGVVAGIVCA